MILLTIKDIRQFMSGLLIKDTFDAFLLSEAVVVTSNSFTIDGRVNRSYFSDEEWSSLSEKKYRRWGDIKPFCFHIIKGNKVPSSMKIIFLLPEKECTRLIESGSLGCSPENTSLFINIRYHDNQLNMVTGTAMEFTMDKSLERLFDTYVCEFLSKAAIDYEVS